MERIAKGFIVLVVVGFVGVLLAAALVEKVPPSTIGVKEVRWGGSGIVQQDYEAGFHVGISGYHRWYPLDRRTHFLTFAEDASRTSAGDVQPPLKIRTRDNNDVYFDVTLTYRIIPGEAYKIVMEGNRNVYRDRVAKQVEGKLREELAQLSSEEIYDTEKRVERVQAALEPLGREMEKFHVAPQRILIRAIRFPAGYEKELQGKQLTNQLRQLAERQRAVEEQKAKNESFIAEIEAAEKERRGEWDKRLETMRSDNKVSVAGVLAEAEVYDKRVRAAAEADHATAVATGKLAIDTAEALRNELRNRALDTLGGRIYLARQAAENLQIDSVTLNSNDPSIPSILDIDELVRLLVGADGAPPPSSGD